MKLALTDEREDGWFKIHWKQCCALILVQELVYIPHLAIFFTLLQNDFRQTLSYLTHEPHYRHIIIRLTVFLFFAN